MTISVEELRHRLRTLVEEVPEERLASAVDYLEYLQSEPAWEDEEITADEERALEEGLEDLRGGRWSLLEEARRRLEEEAGQP